MNKVKAMNAYGLVSALTFVFACGMAQAHGSYETPGKTTPAVEQTLKQFERAWNAGNTTQLAMLYAQDAILLPPHMGPLRGRDAIRGYIQDAINAGIHIDTETIGLERHENFAFVVSRHTAYSAGGQVLGRGKSLVILKRTSDGWRLYRDMMNAGISGMGH